MRVVIVGGGAAGVTVASELRKVDKDVDITILEKSDQYTYSACSLPYVISGEIQDMDSITTFDKHFFDSNNIKFLMKAEAASIDRNSKKLKYLKNGKEEELSYDYLVLATGSKPLIPNINGLEKVKYYTLKTKQDAMAIMHQLDKTKNAVIIGGGMIGVELAAALSSRNIKTTIAEAQKQILSAMLDPSMSQIVERYLVDKGVAIITDLKAPQVIENKVIADTSTVPFDFLAVACGFQPEVTLAKQAGLEVERGIKVRSTQQTSDEVIFACGDCVEVHQCAWLATNAVQQARVVAQNILGNWTELPEMLNTMVSHIGGLIIASTGSTSPQLEASGKKPISSLYTGETRAEYCPKAKKMTVNLIAIGTKLRGCQIISQEEVVGRINWAALAIQHGLEVNQLANAESAYNPVASAMYDPLIVAAQILQKKLLKADEFL
ncbi:FAD-dependent oxidoreductase [Candidatus Woesearchaeota archaeon]|nr:FAD-dependent oxidoreductase [Candidatus Woesearchaeota archaeon]